MSSVGLAIFKATLHRSGPRLMCSKRARAQSADQARYSKSKCPFCCASRVQPRHQRWPTRPYIDCIVRARPQLVCSLLVLVWGFTEQFLCSQRAICGKQPRAAGHSPATWPIWGSGFHVCSTSLAIGRPVFWCLGWTMLEKPPFSVSSTSACPPIVWERLQALC